MLSLFIVSVSVTHRDYILKENEMKFFKWFKRPEVKGTRFEVAKDYFSDDDEYINAKNGWEKLPDQFIELKEKENVKK